MAGGGCVVGQLTFVFGTFCRDGNRVGNKDVLDFLGEEVGQVECQREAWVVFSCLNGVDGLAGDAEFGSQAGLGPVVLRA